MQEEIKEILDYLKDFIEEDRLEQINLNRWFISSLLDYITNLQNLCNKYEEEHKTTFEEWKKDIKANKKAIEYIELGLANEEEAEELLNILKGDNK